LRHLEQGKNVAMYQTSISCIATRRLHGSLVVSMRPIRTALLDRVIEITGRYPLAHGAPIHIGDPLALGIPDLGQPDWGDAVAIEDDEVPVFWACGVTPQAVIMEVQPDIAITHSPGHMFLTDWRDTSIVLSVIIGGGFLKQISFYHHECEDEGISCSPGVFSYMYDITEKLDRFCGKWFLQSVNW
jgi:hypothetical protein